MGCYSFFKGIFPTQGSILSFLHQHVCSLPVSHCKLDCRSLCRLVTYISLPHLCVAQLTVSARLLKTPTSQAPEATTVSPPPLFLNRLKKRKCRTNAALECWAYLSGIQFSPNLTLSSQLFGAFMKMCLLSSILHYLYQKVWYELPILPSPEECLQHLLPQLCSSVFQLDCCGFFFNICLSLIFNQIVSFVDKTLPNISYLSHIVCNIMVSKQIVLYNLVDWLIKGQFSNLQCFLLFVHKTVFVPQREIYYNLKIASIFFFSPAFPSQGGITPIKPADKTLAQTGTQGVFLSFNLYVLSKERLFRCFRNPKFWQ